MRITLQGLFRHLIQGGAADELPSLRELKAAQAVGSNRRSMDERNAEAARRLEAAMNESGLAGH